MKFNSFISRNVRRSVELLLTIFSLISAGPKGDCRIGDFRNEEDSYRVSKENKKFS